MLSCAGADRLQTGMRGAFGKPYGTVARVRIGQVLMSVRTREGNADHAKEALRRAKDKFPGRHYVVVSKNYGFTNIPKDQYEKLKEEKKLIYMGAHVTKVKNRGRLEDLKKLIISW